MHQGQGHLWFLQTTYSLQDVWPVGGAQASVTELHARCPGPGEAEGERSVGSKASGGLGSSCAQAAVVPSPSHQAWEHCRVCCVTPPWGQPNADQSGRPFENAWKADSTQPAQQANTGPTPQVGFQI